MNAYTTAAVPGTDFLVSYESGRYCATTVYLHREGETITLARRIGTVSQMVGHGAYALGGEVIGGHVVKVADVQFRTPTGQRLSTEAAAVLLGQWAAGTAA